MKAVRADTPEARAIWEQVERAAQGVPAWVKPQVEKAAKEAADRIIERQKERESAAAVAEQARQRAEKAMEFSRQVEAGAVLCVPGTRGWAIEQLKAGKRVRRESWQYIAYQELRHGALWTVGVDGSEEAEAETASNVFATDWELVGDAAPEGTTGGA